MRKITIMKEVSLREEKRDLRGRDREICEGREREICEGGREISPGEEKRDL